MEGISLGSHTPVYSMYTALQVSRYNKKGAGASKLAGGATHFGWEEKKILKIIRTFAALIQVK